jgi:hypothetical protein
MLARLFQCTVSALCYEMAGAHAAPAGEDVGEELAGPYNDIARFVLRQHRRMPRLLGSGIELATVLFAFAALARHGALFHRLRPSRRHVPVAAWTTSRLAPCRDLMKFYSSLVILALYSRPCLAEALEQPE